jgi:hypothetical protein
MYYLAYGSNLNVKQMAMRCPDARPIEAIVIEGWQLTFRGVADIEPKADAMLSAGIWKITKKCEKALDRYEGFPTLYGKIYFNFEIEGKNQRVLSYQMNRSNYAYPNQSYYDCIKQGYNDFNLNTKFLEEARNSLIPNKYRNFLSF